MPVDPNFGMAQPNWVQQGSYLVPAAIPITAPNAAPLIQLPCVNREWIPLILGCLDQLRNPSTWDAIDDDHRASALVWADTLRDMFGALPCGSDCMMRLNSCNLQTSTDGGATWVTVPGWAETIDACIKSHIPPPIPPNPRPVPPDQAACNIAGFIATEVIQLCLSSSVAAYGLGVQAGQWAKDIAAKLSFAFPMSTAFVVAAVDFYDYITSYSISQFTTASTDPVLVEDVTCAIFTAIRAVGYISAANLATVVSNICAIVYSQPLVMPALCTFVTKMSLEDWQAIQVTGAIDDRDCSGCTGADLPWCHYWDFSVNNGLWNAETGDGGWVNSLEGNGWYSQQVGGHNKLHLYKTFPTAAHVTQVDFLIFCPNAQGGLTRSVYVQNPCGVTNVSFIDIDFPGPTGAALWVTVGGLSGLADCVKIYWEDNDAIIDQASVILAAQIHGTGTNPFGANNCVR
jgi:hypothetical protein